MHDRIGRSAARNRNNSKLIRVVSKNPGISTINNSSLGTKLKFIKTEYRELCINIFNMLARDDVRIYEIIKDVKGNTIGEVELTSSNFDRDNKTQLLASLEEATIKQKDDNKVKAEEKASPYEKYNKKKNKYDNKKSNTEPVQQPTQQIVATNEVSDDNNLEEV